MDFVQATPATADAFDPEPQRARQPRTEPTAFSDAQRYAWIRGNRGNFLINEALSRANYDSDFDALIDAAMRAHGRGLHLPALPMPDGQRRRRSDWD